jgi:hypothetical protein
MALARSAYLTNPLILDSTSKAVVRARKDAESRPLGKILPEATRRWLARVRLLEGVPFAHLVPDSELLPPESIRFFYLDREWTDALMQGAMSVGTANSLDRQHLQALHARIRDEVDAEERQIRFVGGDPPGRAPAETIAGFVLRSRAVSGWPGLHVRGYRNEVGADDAEVRDNDPSRLRLLRLERLAPAVLFCLFDGVPRIVHIEEPRQGIQFGVNLVTGAGGVTVGATVALRDVLTSKRLDQTVPAPAGATAVDVPFRGGAAGVVDVLTLTQRIAAQGATNVNTFGGLGVDSAEFAMEMLQFPFRQVFGDPAKSTAPGAVRLEFAEVFRPEIGIAAVRKWERGEHS